MANSGPPGINETPSICSVQRKMSISDEWDFSFFTVSRCPPQDCHVASSKTGLRLRQYPAPCPVPSRQIIISFGSLYDRDAAIVTCSWEASKNNSYTRSSYTRRKMSTVRLIGRDKKINRFLKTRTQYARNLEITAHVVYVRPWNMTFPRLFFIHFVSGSIIYDAPHEDAFIDGMSIRVDNCASYFINWTRMDAIWADGFSRMH